MVSTKRRRVLDVIAFSKFSGSFEVYESDVDSEIGQDGVEEGIRASVEVGGRDDLVADLGDGDDRIEDRGRARCGGNRSRPAFERGYAVLEHRVRRVHQPGVDVAEFLQGEKVRRMLGALEDEGARPGYGYAARKADGIGDLPGVDGGRLESLFDFIGHDCLRMLWAGDRIRVADECSRTVAMPRATAGPWHPA